MIHGIAVTALFTHFKIKPCLLKSAADASKNHGKVIRHGIPWLFTQYGGGGIKNGRNITRSYSSGKISVGSSK